MKILFINLPYHGHVVPTIGLVQELVKRGCEVTYLMPFDWKEKIEESGAVFAGYENHRQLSEQMKNAYTAAEKIIGKFDAVVYEQFFFLGKHLAEKCASKCTYLQKRATAFCSKNGGCICDPWRYE